MLAKIYKNHGYFQPGDGKKYLMIYSLVRLVHFLPQYNLGEHTSMCGQYGVMECASFFFLERGGAKPLSIVANCPPPPPPLKMGNDQLIFLGSCTTNKWLA